MSSPLCHALLALLLAPLALVLLCLLAGFFFLVALLRCPADSYSIEADSRPFVSPLS